MTNLGSLGGAGYATGINDSGRVVGFSQDAGFLYKAFLYNGVSMVNLGTLVGGAESYATSINNSGQIVGVSQVNGLRNHAFLYTSGSMIDLGTLDGGGDSAATGINKAGQIVGQSHTARLPVQRRVDGRPWHPGRSLQHSSWH